MRRRDFLRNSVGLAAAGMSFPVLSSRALAAPKRGANDQIRVGFIGCGGRARQLMSPPEELEKHGKIVAVADCFFTRCGEAAKQIPGGDKWKLYPSYAEMLEKEKLDCVFVETTTHGRVLIMMHCLQAGLDVYGEKPLTLTVAEGRTLVKAVKKYNRILQVGTQQRSMPANIYGNKLIQSGAIGKIKEVVAFNFEGPAIWRPKPAEPMPEKLDWDQWCNQTEIRPFRNELRAHWALFRDYDGGGQSYGVTGWGTHALDQVQAALGTDDTGPVEIWPEDKDESGWVKVTMRYENGTLLKCHGKKRGLEDLGAIFVGEKGTLDIRRNSLLTDRPELLKDQPTTRPANIPSECIEHLANFFECMRSRKQPNAPVEAGHRATTLCHLMNICREVNRKLHWDPKAEQFQSDPEANKLLSRERRKGYELPKV